MVTKEGSRDVAVQWEDTIEEGAVALLTLRLPVRVDWNAAQRKKVQQAVADAALHALYSIEQDGMK